ncbi:MAG: DUF3298 domain-containing protein [Lamprobacter sp.]|uniref:DUF3298 and DUF4163 domain-containing protein n=1 Tax=Lamprobacter sp. TaxID=3100796 RepID=UPI002B25AC48|nr:DUF3298 domain-containing protein [Lamprobacter sp.]MEA3640436.1 DUF3298 domain-containing protein [Lamprobacter sp.]
MTATVFQHTAAAALLLVSASGNLTMASEIGPVEVTHEDGLVRLTQDGPNIEIAAQFVQLSDTGGEPADGINAANRLIEQQVLDQIDAFRNEYQGFLDGNDGEHLGPPWGLSITGELLYQGPTFWTLDLETYHFTGGAHGGTENHALLLSRQTGEPIPVSALFKPGSDWLQRLSEASYQALIQRESFEPDDEWLVSGTAPEPDNYQVLLPMAEGLEVVFGLYQIGPYAIGITRVRLPYSALNAVLNPDLFPNQEP